MNTTTVMRAWLLALSLVAGLSGCWWDSDGKKKLNITSEPASATAVVGATATVSVQANTNKATYQWRRNGTDIAGATSATSLSLDRSTSKAGAELEWVMGIEPTLRLSGSRIAACPTDSTGGKKSR